MSPEISERSFEEAIECALLEDGPDACAGDTTAVRETPPPYGDTPPGGYRKRKPEDYDRTLCLLPRDAVDFVLATQPKEWKKLEQHHGKEAVREQFLKRLAAEIERRGALDVLRSGIKDSGCKFRLAYFRPASGLNEETRRLHAANLESDDKFMRHLAQIVRNGLGDRAGTCIAPKTQIVQGKTVCVVSCQRSPEPVFLRWKGLEAVPEGDFFVRSGPGTVKLPPDSAQEYIRTRFRGFTG